MQLRKEDIIKYCETFIGYGSLSADIAIIGMEEGDKKEFHTINRVNSRIQIVLKLLKNTDKKTIDFLESHKLHAPNIYKALVDNKSFSVYWRAATRVVMKALDKDANDVRGINIFLKLFVERACYFRL